MLSVISSRLESGQHRTCKSECHEIYVPWAALFMSWSNNFLPIRAIAYYKRAAELGDKRAAQRLRGPQSQPVHQPGGPGAVLHRGSGDDTSKGGKDKDCLIM